MRLRLFLSHFEYLLESTSASILDLLDSAKRIETNTAVLAEGKVVCVWSDLKSLTTEVRVCYITCWL